MMKRRRSTAMLAAGIACACVAERAGGTATTAWPSAPRRAQAAAARTLRVTAELSSRGSGCAWVGSRFGQSCKELSPSLSAAAKLRGGAEDDWDDDAAVVDDDVGEDQFAEDSHFKRILQAWNKTPLMTKNFVQASLGLTLFVFAVLGNEWPDLLLLEWGPTLFRLQLWRPLAPFLYYGPLSISYVITVHFMWTYMSELERRLYQTPEDFFMMVAFGAASLVLVSTLVSLDSRLLGHSLSCYFVYNWSRQYEGAEVNVLDMFNLRVELLPWFFVAQTLLLEGQPPVLDLVGIFVGYLYQFLRMKKLLRAPGFIKDIFRLPAIRQDYQRKFAAEFGQSPDDGAAAEDETPPEAETSDDTDDSGPSEGEQ